MRKMDSMWGDSEVFEVPEVGVRTILLVEDDAIDRASIKALLSKSGFHVVDVATPLDAQLQATAGRKIDLLITDYQMPLQNGVQLARWFRERWPRVPVVVATGVPERASVDDAFHPSFICWHKAWDPSSLVHLAKQMTTAAVM